MKIGIDISQIVHEGTGVARYVTEIVTELLKCDSQNEYILFGSSFRKKDRLKKFCDSMKQSSPKTRCVLLPIPPFLLDILWNLFHVFPITRCIGNIDVFWSSDWTQPPLRNVKGITTIHDVSFLRYPESFDKKIISVQKRRLFWAKKECAIFLCDSESTKSDVMKYMNIPKEKLRVIYPGY